MLRSEPTREWARWIHDSLAKLVNGLRVDDLFEERLLSPRELSVGSALKVLLFVMAERELEVRSDAESFYKAERQRWSERLRHAREQLVPEESMVAVAERTYVAEGARETMLLL